MKTILKEHRFQSREERKEAMKAEVDEFSGKNLQECLQQWYGYWQKCIRVKGNYFRGDVHKDLPLQQESSQTILTLVYRNKLNI